MKAKTLGIVEDLKAGKLNLCEMAEKHAVSRQYIHQVAVRHVPDYKEGLLKVKRVKLISRVNKEQQQTMEVKQKRQAVTADRITKGSLLWRAGLKIDEFARLMDLTVGSAYMFVDRMRKQVGSDLYPFRKERQKG